MDECPLAEITGTSVGGWKNPVAKDNFSNLFYSEHAKILYFNTFDSCKTRMALLCATF